MQALTYDGDGWLVRSIMDEATTYNPAAHYQKETGGGVTILFVGGHYEVKGSEITKYYFAGSTRIAMRTYTIPQSMTVEYFLTDHLGSTSLSTDSGGNKIAELRYTAWGEIRYTWGTTPTNYT